jgi:hypothetical protein
VVDVPWQNLFAESQIIRGDVGHQQVKLNKIFHHQNPHETTKHMPYYFISLTSL